MDDLPLVRRRRGIRRHVRSRCRAMHWDRCEIVGHELLDLSPQGALLSHGGGLRVGDALLVGFRMPWLGPEVLVTAEVARLVRGRRTTDRGECAGLRFLDLDRRSRAELDARLAPFEPAAAAREHPIDYALAVGIISQQLPDEPGILIG
jgi:hypothetical protein